MLAILLKKKRSNERVHIANVTRNKETQIHINTHKEREGGGWGGGGEVSGGNRDRTYV